MAGRAKSDIPSKEQIESWRTRWESFPGLADEIAHILRTNENGEITPAKTEDGKWDEAEVARRMIAVHDCLLAANEGWTQQHPGKDIPFHVVEDRSEWKEPWWRAIPVPPLDLRGIDWSQQSLDHVAVPFTYLCGSDLRGAKLHGADLRRTNFHDADLSGIDLHSADLEGAKLHGADLQFADLQGTHLWGTDFHGADLYMVSLYETFLFGVDLHGANMREVKLSGANFERTDLQGVDLRGSHLQSTDLSGASLAAADLSFANVGVWNPKRMESSSNARDGHECRYPSVQKRTTFANNDYIPSPLVRIWRWVRDHRFPEHSYPSTWWRYFLTRWWYTNCDGVKLDEADTIFAPDFARYVKDQQYVKRFFKKHRVLGFFWWLFSDFGYSIGRVLFWSLAVVALFAWFYSGVPYGSPWEWLPDSVANFVTVDGSFMLDIDPKLKRESISGPMRWLFVSFDIFTNLGIHPITPVTNIGIAIVMFQNALGYGFLGLLISVFASRFARRAA